MGNECDPIIELAAESDAKALAVLHSSILPGSRMSLFGKAYLADCYRYFIGSRDELVFVVRSDGSVVGGAFVSLAPGSLPHRLVTHTLLLVQLALRPLGRGARQIVADLLQPVQPATGRDQPELVAIFVAPEHQGRGIGEMICRTVEAELIRHQIGSYVVHTERDAGNRAIAFYQRLGFKTAEPTQESYRLMLLCKSLL